ncbi:MAG: LLM class flavin-dependent oxidoreductase [Actinomycetia bacterium]|nr:LLM class flavin-dependent oxidoreductase [Actinomycetes bacterium]
MDLTLWPLVSQPWSDLCAAVELVERLGWHGVMIEDHFMADGGGFGAVSDPRFEVTSVLSALAVATTSVRLAPLVMSATYRHPAVVANWAATVDHISRGRLTLGLGAGWQLNEHAQYGIQLGTPGERIDRLDEYCTVVRSLLEQAVTDFKGRSFELSNAWCEPKPLQTHLPLLIGGKGDRMLRLVARHADTWNMWSMPSKFAERSAVLDQSSEAIGRDPATIRRSTQALVCLTDSASEARSFIDAAGGRAAFAGTAEQFADLAAQWHDAGVDELVIPDWYLGTGTQRAESIEAITAALQA